MRITKSICRKPGYLHDYKVIAQHQQSDYFVIEERCLRCQKRMFFKMDSWGRTDNVNYLRHHIKNALPTFHPRYKHEYGNSN